MAIPRGTSLSQAQEFVRSKKAWIQKRLAEIRDYEKGQEAFRDALSTIDKAEAGRKLRARLASIAKKHGFTYNKVTIRAQRTRWGSCSAKNNISLNVKLVLLPGELTGYVLLHELVHTRIHNHSKKFWAELDKYVSDSKAMAKRLRTHDLRLP